MKAGVYKYGSDEEVGLPLADIKTGPIAWPSPDIEVGIG